MFQIEELSALEILDSRGRPTLQATCLLADGSRGTASVPSGASTGAAEALELRDGDQRRYRGLGCRQAVAHVNDTVHDALARKTFPTQAALDQAMLQLDGTANKSRLGANAILSVSLAFARAAAQQRGVPLYNYFAELPGNFAGQRQPNTDPPRGQKARPILTPAPSHRLGAGGSPDRGPRTLPRPTINLFSGGKHAGGQSPLQDVLVVPAAARTLADALAMTFEVYQCAAELSAVKYGMRLLRADEGGLAPPFAGAETMLDDAVAAIRAAGFEPGRDVALAIDVASTHFYQRDGYRLGPRLLDCDQMIDQLARWVAQYPIVSVEDGLAEDDWDHWPKLRARLAGRALTVGDDLLCTNPARIARAVQLRAADALLLKVNQIGSVTEALEAYRLARSAGWQVTISARSGETEDDWLADLAVGWAGDQIKIGSITQSDRLSKYNRLLAIEAATGLPLVEWPQAAKLDDP